MDITSIKQARERIQPYIKRTPLEHIQSGGKNFPVL